MIGKKQFSTVATGARMGGLLLAMLFVLASSGAADGAAYGPD